MASVVSCGVCVQLWPAVASVVSCDLCLAGVDSSCIIDRSPCMVERFLSCGGPVGVDASTGS